MASAARVLVSPTPETPALSRRLDRMARLAACGPEQAIGVAGPDAADAMCGLWRRGYARVEAARRCTCGCADQACGALLVMGGTSADDITALIDAVSRMLEPGGRLVLAVHDLPSEDRARLCNRLSTRGYRYARDAFAEPILLAIKAEASE